MKGLALNSLGDNEKAHEFCKRGLVANMKTHVTWHVYGILYRAEKWVIHCRVCNSVRKTRLLDFVLLWGCVSFCWLRYLCKASTLICLPRQKIWASSSQLQTGPETRPEERTDCAWRCSPANPGPSRTAARALSSRQTYSIRRKNHELVNKNTLNTFNVVPGTRHHGVLRDPQPAPASEIE